MTVNILIGCTGSVAAIKIPQLLNHLKEKENNVNIKLVLTQNSEFFLASFLEVITSKVEIYRDLDEWKDWKQVGDPVLHINLSKWADIFLISPLDANTMAKLANGFCDNLLTCVFRAWDFKKPIICAPAMNTLMWQNPLTSFHVATLKQLGCLFIDPIAKTLACGDTVHPKGGNLQRKALTDIKNVHQSKTVSFETSKPSMHSTKKTNEKDSKVFTPGPKVIKSSVATPAVVKSNNKVKNVASSFKIFEDNKCATNVKKLSFKNKHQEPDEIEYVAPNTDTDHEIELPEYIEKVMNYQPTYNITLFKDDPLNYKAIVTNIQQQIFENANYNIPNEDLLTLIAETSITDEELLWNIENDSSFSLDVLDEELRES